MASVTLGVRARGCERRLLHRSGGDSLALRAAALGVSCVCCNGCGPPKGSNGEQGPDGAKSAKAFFTLTSAFAKASAVALRAMADKTADRPSLSHQAERPAGGRGGFTLTPSLSHPGRGVYETASKPYGSDGSITDEYGLCQYILTPRLNLQRVNLSFPRSGCGP